MERRSVRLSGRALAGVAVGCAMFAVGCGREPTEALGLRAVFALAQADQANEQGVGAAFVNLYKVETDGSRRTLTSTPLSPTDAVKIGFSSDEITLSLTFPLQGYNSVYEVEGAATSILGVKLYALGPARFTERDLTAPGGARIPLMVKYVGPPLPIPPLVPTAIQVLSGGGQSGLIGLLLAAPIRLRVLGGATGSTPVPGVTVNFRPRLGTVSPASAVTDSLGVAQTRWTLGSLLGSQLLDITTAGVSAVVVTATGLPLGLPLPPLSLPRLPVIPLVP